MPARLRITAEQARRVVARIPANGLRKKLLDHFLRNFGVPVPQRVLVDVLYGGDPQGGPLCAEKAVGVHIYFLRKKLKPHGLELCGEVWRGTTLRWASST